MPTKKRVARIRQVLPDVRIVPRVQFSSEDQSEDQPQKGSALTGIVVTRKLADKLSKIALLAYARAKGKTAEAYENEPLVVILAPNKAANAASHFVSEKEFEITPANFRRLIADKGKSSVKRAAIELLEKMPPAESPPFPQH
jgi:hypothetical protein